MRRRSNLWLIKVSVSARFAERLSAAFEKESVAVTVLAPPRSAKARIEILADSKPDKALVATKLAVLSAAMGMKPPTLSICPAPFLDWLKKVAADFPPLKIGPWTVHGAAHRKKVPDRKNALQIDATSAFGTGEHPTTRGCLLMLHRILKNGFLPETMADIGCGSGILAMACAQKTGCKAFGVDLDKASAHIAKKNACANDLASKVRFAHGNGYAARLIAGHAPFDLIMSNIFAKPLCEMAKDLKKNLRPGGIAILSGLLNTQAADVIAAHKKQRLILFERMKIGEWTVLAFRRPKRA